MKAFTGVPTDSRFRNTLTAGVATENADNVAMYSEGDHRSDLFLAGCADKGYILCSIRVKRVYIECELKGRIYRIVLFIPTIRDWSAPNRIREWEDLCLWA